MDDPQQPAGVQPRQAAAGPQSLQYDPRQPAVSAGLSGLQAAGKAGSGGLAGQHPSIHPAALNGQATTLPHSFQDAHMPGPSLGSTSTHNLQAVAPPWGYGGGLGLDPAADTPAGFGYQFRQPAYAALPAHTAGLGPAAHWQPGKAPGPQIGASAGSLGSQIGSTGVSQAFQAGAGVGLLHPHIGAGPVPQYGATPGLAPGLPRGTIGTADPLGRRPSFGSTPPGSVIGQISTSRTAPSPQRMIGQRATAAAFGPAASLQYLGSQPMDGSSLQRSAIGPQFGMIGTSPSAPVAGAGAGSGSFPGLTSLQQSAGQRQMYANLPERQDSDTTTASLGYNPSSSRLNSTGTVDSLSGLDHLSVSQESMRMVGAGGPFSGPHSPRVSPGTPSTSQSRPLSKVWCTAPLQLPYSCTPQAPCKLVLKV